MSREATPLNYDPTDPDKMRLPSGKTCGDCFHIRRCKMIYGHTEVDAYCDWSPSRFSIKETRLMATANFPCGSMGEEVAAC